jgi:hypothetical protein
MRRRTPKGLIRDDIPDRTRDERSGVMPSIRRLRSIGSTRHCEKHTHEKLTKIGALEWAAIATTNVQGEVDRGRIARPRTNPGRIMLAGCERLDAQWSRRSVAEILEMWKQAARTDIYPFEHTKYEDHARALTSNSLFAILGESLWQRDRGVFRR